MYHVIVVADGQAPEQYSGGQRDCLQFLGRIKKYREQKLETFAYMYFGARMEIHETLSDDYPFVAVGKIDIMPEELIRRCIPIGNEAGCVYTPAELFDTKRITKAQVTTDDEVLDETEVTWDAVLDDDTDDDTLIPGG